MCKATHAVGVWWKESAPKALHLALVVGAGALAAIAVGAIAVGVLRAISTRRTLARRTRYVLLPTDSFEPSQESILRFTGQLSRIRRASWGSFDRPATALRIRLDGLTDGRMTFGLEAPARSASLIHSVRYDEVELRPAAEFHPEATPIDGEDIDDPSSLEPIYRQLSSEGSSAKATGEAA
jgi:hypothetical protein